MILKLKNIIKNEECTISKLYVDDIFECYILEDAIRSKKIDNETAIPSGEYEVIISYSNRFKKELPLLLNVPNYKGVRIHSGNDKHDTEGCLLTGKNFAKNKVTESRIAFNSLFGKLKKASKSEKIFIKIER